MRALQQTAQHDVSYLVEGKNWQISTQWSAVFDMTLREAYLCLGGDYSKVYKLKVPAGI